MIFGHHLGKLLITAYLLLRAMYYEWRSTDNLRFATILSSFRETQFCFLWAVRSGADNCNSFLGQALWNLGLVLLLRAGLFPVYSLSQGRVLQNPKGNLRMITRAPSAQLRSNSKSLPEPLTSMGPLVAVYLWLQSLSSPDFSASLVYAQMPQKEKHCLVWILTMGFPYLLGL